MSCIFLYKSHIFWYHLVFPHIFFVQYVAHTLVLHVYFEITLNVLLSLLGCTSTILRYALYALVHMSHILVRSRILLYTVIYHCIALYILVHAFTYSCIPSLLLWYNPDTLRYTQVCLVYSGTYVSYSCMISYSLVHCHLPLYCLVYPGIHLYIFLYTITVTLVQPWYTQVCLVCSGTYVSYSCTILVFSCTPFVFCHDCHQKPHRIAIQKHKSLPKTMLICCQKPHRFALQKPH